MTIGGRKNRCVLLQDAAYYFAPRDLKEVWSAAGHRSWKSEPPNASKDIANTIKDIANTVQSGLDHVRKRSEPRWEAERQLIAKLISGKLVARGFQVRPELEEEIKPIPPYFFEPGKIQWQKNMVEYERHKFARVEICRPSQASTILPRVEEIAKPPETLKPRRLPGPQSAGPFIIAEYERMKNAGGLAGCNNVKAIWIRMHPILSKRIDLFPEGRGLEYPSFARHLREHRKSK